MPGPRQGDLARGVVGLDLSTGDYTITPSEEKRDWGDRVADVLSGDVEDGDELHAYDVVDAQGDFVVAIVEKKVRLGDEDDFMTAIEWHHDFRTLDGETLLTMDKDETLYAAGGEDVVAKWERSFPVLGDWQLLTPDGETRATVTPTGFLRGFFSSHGSYVVSDPGGDELARFDHVRAEGSLSEMEVTVTGSSVAPEVPIALGFSTLNRAVGSNADGGGAPP